MSTQLTHHTLAAQIDQCMLSDRYRLGQRLRGIVQAQNAGRAARQLLESLAAAIQRSSAQRQRRADLLPRPTYPEDLPIAQTREQIARAIAEHQVVIVCGETGSGKTTQIPKICLELGRGVAGMIGHTQPRRIAARTIAARINTELNAAPAPGLRGAVAAYKIRFDDKIGPDTFIKVMTDGVLLAETQSDRFLEQYDTLLIDEAHERSLNIDFLLGYLKHVLPRRPDLKLIIASATIDPQRFSEHFGGPEAAPVVEVSGRSYPIETRYRPLVAEDPGDTEPDVLTGIGRALDEVLEEPSGASGGDVLVFLSGERDIRDAAEYLRGRVGTRAQILPLYARLPAEAQQRVFQPHPGRRIVLATNVAETSLTVPGIRYVIDPGYARLSRYSPRSKVQRLPIEPISQASADQRQGRCGRLGPGMCYRLYSEEEYQARPQFTPAEILRTNLASVILQMMALRLGTVERFPFLAPPEPRMVRDGYATLRELGAVDDKGELTSIGRRLARLPLDPRLGRMILAAQQEGCLAEVLVVAAALSVQDPRLRPADAEKLADDAHAAFRDEGSDFVSWLNLWHAYHEQSWGLSRNQLRKWCRVHYLSATRMREWVDVHRQIHSIASELGLRVHKTPARDVALHRALLAGLISNIGTRGERHEYHGTRSTRFHLFPGSTLFRKEPKWVMAAELVETTRLYARTLARINPEWVERLAPHLVQRTYSDPHWDSATGHVRGLERVAMFGLTLISGRSIHYGRIDPVLSRQLFIRHALVEGDFRTRAEFFHHNMALLADVRELEAKTRRHDLLIRPEQVYAFYDARIPADVHSGPQFERWLHEARQRDPQVLFLRRQDVQLKEVPQIVAGDFPDFLRVGDMELPLEYRFEPGEPADGVTVTLPLPALNQLAPARFDWLVPGFLPEKIAALIKSLPKALRVRLVPAPQFAQQATESLPPSDRPLVEALGEFFAVPADAFVSAVVPEHLRMRFRVVDQEQREVAASRDLGDLQRLLRQQAAIAFEEMPDSPFHRDGITAWDFGDLPEHVEVQHAGMTLLGYPALLDRGDSVSLRLLDSGEAAQHAMQAGVRRLLLLAVEEDLHYVLAAIPELDELARLYSPLGPREELHAQLREMIVQRVFLSAAGLDPVIRTHMEFELRLRERWHRVDAVVREAVDLLAPILEEYQPLAALLEGGIPPMWTAAAVDAREQLTHLLGKGFMVRTPWEWLQQYPRYLRAIHLRFQKLTSFAQARDAQHAAELNPWWERYLQRRRQHEQAGIHDPALAQFRWMLEELRVSLFAQELKTAVPVSFRRLEDQWARVRPG